MTFIKSIKLKLKKSDFVLYLWNKRRIKRDKEWLEKWSDDAEFVKRQYESVVGVKPDLENPKRYTEKMNWLKLNYRNPLMPVCADKYAVRKYLEDLGYGRLLNDIYGVWENANDIDITSLPDKFVMKATNGSGTNLIVTDKKKVNWRIWKKIMNCWLKQNIYAEGREWVYNEMTPRIVCEKFLEGEKGNLIDYKFACSNGKIDYILVASDRGKKSLTYTYYTTDWKRLPFRKPGYNDKDEKKPEHLSEMIKLATELCKPFPLVRIDFYDFNNKVYFGEFTFFDAGGYMGFEPDEYDLIYGEKVKLPDK